MGTRVWNLLTALMVMPARRSRCRVLAEMNKARESLGLARLPDIPKGIPKKPAACPLSLALNGYVGVDGICLSDEKAARVTASVWMTRWWRNERGQYLVQLPDDLRCFVRDFDLGAYPDLLKREAEPSRKTRDLPAYAFN